MRTKNAIAVFLGAFACVSAAVPQAEPVHVSVRDFDELTHGAGFSVAKGRECFVVTPLHVIKDKSYDGITITDRNGNTDKAVPIKQLEGPDIALLRVEGVDAVKCGAKWKAPSGVSSAIENAQFILGVKQSSNGTRKRARYFLDSASPDRLELAPFNNRDSISRGDSGSTLYVNQKVVGMLLEVDPETGLGVAIPQGHLYGLLSAELDAERKALVALPPVLQNRRENAYATMAVRNLLNKGGNVQLVDAGIDQRTAQPVIPDMAEYVIVARIIDVAYERVANENYKREADRESNSLKRLGDSMLGRNDSERYFTRYLIDVEAEIHNLESKTVVRNLLQQPVLVKKSRSQQTDKEATSTAVANMIERTIQSSEYAGWLQKNVQPVKLKNPFKGLFRRKKDEA